MIKSEGKGFEIENLPASRDFGSHSTRQESSKAIETAKENADTLNFFEDFHIFALEWEPDELRWYIDGVQLFSTKQNVPHIPFYLILNTAVGGDWPGNPNASTKFPQYHFIDYVRIYEKNTQHDL
jgi:beta-glucanase (GH16 family)